MGIKNLKQDRQHRIEEIKIFSAHLSYFKMLHKCYSNTTTCGKHLCSKLVYLQNHVFWAAVLVPENQGPATQSHTPCCASGPTAVSTWTVWHSDPVGAAELCRVFLWTTLVALLSFSQSVSNIYWTFVLKAILGIKVRFFPKGNGMSSPHKWIWATPQSSKPFSLPNLFLLHFPMSLHPPSWFICTFLILEYNTLSLLDSSCLFLELIEPFPLKLHTLSASQCAPTSKLHFQWSVKELSLEKKKKKRKKSKVKVWTS